VSELTTRAKVKKVPPRKRRRDDSIDVRWWKLDGPELAQSAFQVVRAIENTTSTRRELFEKYACQYLDLRMVKSGTATSSLLSRLTPSTARARRCSTNVTASCVDTAGAHTSKNRPRPIYLTSGGDLALQNQARDMTRYMDGLLAMLKAHVTGQTVARDSHIFGTGIGYVYTQLFEDESGKVIDGEIKVERVFVDELRIDEDEARSGLPRQMHRVRLMTRDELIDIFPEHEQAILDAQPARDTRTAADLVEVIESWHLPTGKVRYEKTDGGEDDRSKPITDGCFATTLGGEVTLQATVYTRDYFPFLPLYWSPPLAGFWGRGLAEELQGKQKQINDLDADIDKAIKLGAKIKLLVPQDCELDGDGWSDVIGEQIKFKGPTPPTPIVPPAVGGELYAFRKTLIQECYEISGVSQSQATATKEAGLNSGAAVREQNDINSTRFVLKSQAYEQWYMDLSRMLIDLSRELYDQHKIDLKVKGRAGKFLKTIQWSKVNLDNDAYDMQVFPVSLLPTTPQGRMETVQEMLDKGLISPEAGKRLLDFPDLEEFNSLETAFFDYAAGLVADLLEGGDYEPPDWRADLKMVLNVTLANYVRALRMKVPEQILERLRQLMDECELVIGAMEAGVDMRNQRAFNDYIAGLKPANDVAPPVDPALAGAVDPALAAMDPAAMPPPVDPMLDPAAGAMPPDVPPEALAAMGV
jgi:hypothetical protein